MIEEYNNVYENVYNVCDNIYTNNYESFFILKGSLTEEQALEEIEKIKKYFKNVEIYEKINDQNGYLGLKNLAYPIRGESKGYYYLIHYRSISKKITEIEQNLRLNDNVLKFLTVKIEEE